MVPGSGDLSLLARGPDMTTALRQRMLHDLQLAGLSRAHPGGLPPRRPATRRPLPHPPDRLTEQQVRDYFLHLKNDRKFAAASLGIAYSGIKFFYSHTTPRDWPTLSDGSASARRRDSPTSSPSTRSGDSSPPSARPTTATYFWTVYSLGLRLERRAAPPGRRHR